MKNIKIYTGLSISLILMAACSKDFVDRPSLNNPTLDNYYTNAAEVNAATGYLYNSVWYDFMDKAFHAIGEVLGGNMVTSAGDVNYGSNSYVNFTVLSTDPLVQASWNSYYKVAGNATVLMNTFQEKKSKVAQSAYLDLGIAEARFIRGVAYFMIARTFGDVPIVEDPVALASSGNYNVPRYFQRDVLRFALNDLREASKSLPADPYQPGRVTKYSAIGMMAKIYLYRGDYDSARAAAAEVIASRKYDLHPNYNEMFTTSKANNNRESLFALQWTGAGGYGFGNPVQQYAGPGPLLRPITNTGYSSVTPTIDFVRSIEPGDRRRSTLLMEHGWTRASWKNVNFPNGFTYDTSGTEGETATTLRTGSRTTALKYIVGPGSDGELINQYGQSSNSTYILRYADILLIHAEAILGNSASTSNADALASFNKIHVDRGGLPAVTSLNKDIILKERRVEFAFEGDWWFDLQRLGFAKASAIINAQERGSLNNDGSINSIRANFTQESQLFLPIPQAETVQNKELLKPAVPYF
jgi:hypothetical protein